MQIYAVLNSNTDSVVNLILAEDEKFIFLKTGEYAVPVNRAIQIGMVYDKKKKSFPEAGDKVQLFDLIDQISLIIENHQKLLSENNHLTEDQLQIHLTYIENLNSIRSLATYSQMKLEFDALELPPEIPPAPKEITQDLFRSVLKLTEKILWDNPQTGTATQEATINTLKMEFPYYGVDSMTEELDLLETVGFFTTQRVQEVKQALA